MTRWGGEISSRRLKYGKCVAVCARSAGWLRCLCVMSMWLTCTCRLRICSHGVCGLCLCLCDLHALGI